MLTVLRFHRLGGVGLIDSENRFVQFRLEFQHRFLVQQAVAGQFVQGDALGAQGLDTRQRDDLLPQLRLLGQEVFNLVSGLVLARG